MKRFFYCLVFAVFFLSAVVQAETVLTIFFEVNDFGLDLIQSIPSMTRPSIKATIKTGPATNEYSIRYLKPMAEIIEIGNENILIGRTDTILTAYQEPNKTVIRIIGGTAKIPILIPANTNPDITGAAFENGKILCKMVVDADATKALELKLQFDNGKIAVPVLFLPGSSGCSTLQEIEQNQELIYQVTPENYEALGLFPFNNPLQFDFNTFQITNDRIIIGQPNTVYSLPLPTDKSPRLIAKAAYYQRSSGKQYGDFNGDGSYGYKDLQAVGLKFGQKGNFILEDVNDDGIVNILDMVVMAQNLSKTAAAPPNYFSSYTATIWGNLKR